jgi:hypothetical protein
MKTKEQLAKERYPYQPSGCDYTMENTYDNLQSIQRAAFKAGYEAAQRWISAEEEPIPLNILCNVVDVKGRMFNCSFKTENDMRFGIIFYKITHWLPIPKLPTTKQ